MPEQTAVDISLEKAQTLMPEMEWEPATFSTGVSITGTLFKGDEKICALHLTGRVNVIDDHRWWQFMYIMGDGLMLDHPPPNKKFREMEEAVEVFQKYLAEEIVKKRELVRKLEITQNLCGNA